MSAVHIWRHATATISGIVSISRQNVSGLKGFLGGAYSVGNVRASEGAGTTTLTDDDNRNQIFNLSATRLVVLPTTSIKSGDVWTIKNRGAFDLTVQSSDASPMTIAGGANQDATVNIGRVVLRALQDTPTTEAHWLVEKIEETYTYSTAWSFSTGTGQTNSKAVLLTRIGNVVTVVLQEYEALNAVTSTTPSSLQMDTGIPTRFRPLTASALFLVRTRNAGADLVPPGVIRITQSTGRFDIYRDVAFTAYSSGSSAGASAASAGSAAFTYIAPGS